MDAGGSQGLKKKRKQEELETAKSAKKLRFSHLPLIASWAKKKIVTARHPFKNANGGRDFGGIEREGGKRKCGRGRRPTLIARACSNTAFPPLLAATYDAEIQKKERKGRKMIFIREVVGSTGCRKERSRD